MVPKMDFANGWVERIALMFDKNSLDPQTTSIVAGISHLLSEGDVLVGGLILLFSVLFPVAKLATIFVLISNYSPSR
jgi:uncharacterized paraquat-inducible protein A